MIELGEVVIDKVSGFKGVAIARCEYLNGCIGYEVQPACTPDGKMPQAIWIDWQQLEVKKKPKPRKKTRHIARHGGGPADRPPTRSTPKDRPYRGQGYYKNGFMGEDVG